VDQSSPYYGDIWRRYCCLTIFFRLSIRALVAKIWPDKVVQWCRDGDFLRPVFTASCVQHVSDLHPEFALRPHHYDHVRNMLSPVCLSSVCLSSVTLVHATQTVGIFPDVSMPFGTLTMHWHPQKILRRCPRGTPPSGGLNASGVAKYSDFGSIEGYISGTVQDRR